MALGDDDAQDIVLRFSTKGSDVTVRQIKSVEKATDSLADSTSDASTKGASAWDRYSRSAGSSLASLAKVLAASELAHRAFSTSILVGLASATRAYRSGGLGLAAAAGLAAKTAAATFEATLLGKDGMAGTLSRLRMLAAAGGSGSASALLGAGLTVAGGTLVGRGGLTGGAGHLLTGAGATIGKLGIGGTLAAATGVGAAVMGGAALLKWGAGGMSGASDRIEYANRVNSLLGAGGTQAALAGAGNTARNMGLTRTEYINQYGALTAQLMGAGMNQAQASAGAARLVRGAADLGSFNNLDTSQAAEAIQAGLRGEMDPLERAGVFLNQKAIDVQAQKLYGRNTTELTASEAVNARMAAITGSMGWSQAGGDFQRSWATSLANQQKSTTAAVKDSQEDLGEALNKILLALMPLAQPLVSILKALVNVVVPVLNLVATLLKPVSAFFDLFSGSSGPMSTTTTVSREGYVGGAAGAGIAATRVDVGDRIVTSKGTSGTFIQKKGTHWEPGVGTAGGRWVKNAPGKASGGMVPGWSPGIDNVLVPLSGGEGILTPETVAMMGGAGAIDAMNLAGLRRRGSGYANGASAAQAVAGMIGRVSNKQAASGIYIPGRSGTDSTVTGAGLSPTTTFNGSLPDLSSAGLPSSVTRWASTAAQALSLTGDYSAQNLIALLNQMNHESSGNADAINDWDSNAARGTPSKGLMQVIQPTFSSYAMPGYDRQLTDPLSNIIASIRYTKATYGDLGYWTRNGYNAYDSGGWLPPGAGRAVNATGKPEAVLTDDQWGDMKKLADGAASGVQVHIGQIVISGGGGNLSSSIEDDLADALAARINRARDRSL